MSDPVSNLAARLNRRRQALGMSYSALAHRSGVSEATIKRILAGRAPQASFAKVQEVAAALGFSLEVRELDGGEELRQSQALTKAKRVARMVQGTSALEGQAVDEDTYRQLVERSYHELLAGPNRRLWSQ